MTSIFTILGLAVTIILFVFFNHATGFEFNSFSLFFIIPIGGLFVGAGSSVGLFSGLLFTNKPVNRNHYLLGAALGFIAFWGIYYVSYITTYIDTKGEVNYSFQGEAISNYEIEGEEISFSKFLNISKNTESQFFFHGRPIGDGIDTGGGFGNFMFYLHLIAAMLAGAFVGLSIVGDKNYCGRCKKYMKEKTLFKFELDRYEEIADRLLENKDQLEGLRSIIKSTELKDKEVKSFVQTDLEYCPSCHDSRMLIKIFNLSGSNFEEATQFRKYIVVIDKVSKGLLIN